MKLLLLFVSVVLATPQRTILYSNQDELFNGNIGNRQTSTVYCQSLPLYSQMNCTSAFAALNYGVTDTLALSTAVNVTLSVTGSTGIQIAKNWTIYANGPSGWSHTLSYAGVTTVDYWSGEQRSCSSWSTDTECLNGGIDSNGKLANCSSLKSIVCVCIGGQLLGTPFPTTLSPSGSPTTSNPSTTPSKTPHTSNPTHSPSTSKPTNRPTTSNPTHSPITSRPSSGPTKLPTSQAPSSSPTTSTPSISPTISTFFTQSGSIVTPPPVASGSSLFGSSVSISADGNYLVVGAEADAGGIGGAYIYHNSGGGTWTLQTSKLVGTGYIGNGNQGTTVSISGDGGTVIVGAPLDDIYADGAFWTYTRSGSTWSQLGSKTQFSKDTEYHTGYSSYLNYNGTIAMIGNKPGISQDYGFYVATRSGSSWSGVQILYSDYIGVGINTEGFSVSMDDTANLYVECSPTDNTVIGACWVFGKTGSSYPELTKIIPTGYISSSPKFGKAVRISGDGSTIVVGATGDDYYNGVAYIFTGSGSSWSTFLFFLFRLKKLIIQKTAQRQRLTGSGSPTYFGSSVTSSYSGSIIIIGGYGTSSYDGETWVYIKSGSTWSLTQTLVGIGGTNPSRQGYSLTCDSLCNTLVVGGYYDNSEKGAFWTFTNWITAAPTTDSPTTSQPSRNPTTSQPTHSPTTSQPSKGPTHHPSISPTHPTNQPSSSPTGISYFIQPASKVIGTGGGELGYSVSQSFNGYYLAVGAPGDGITYVYTNNGPGIWNNNPQRLIGTGGSVVSISGDGTTLVVGSPGDNSILFFTRTTSTNWIQQGSMITTPSNPSFGQSVALNVDGSIAVIGASGDDYGPGVTYIYNRNGSIWTLSQSLTGSDSYQGQGYSVAISGTTLIFCSMIDTTVGGACWVYTYSSSTWSQQGSKITPTGFIGPPRFGSSVALSTDGNTAAIGAYADDHYVGCGWIFTRSGGTWSQQQKLTPTGLVDGSQFYIGASITISGDGTIIVLGGQGQYGDIGGGFVFVKGVSSWTQIEIISGSNPIGESLQGYRGSLSCDQSCNTLVMGGFQDNSTQGAFWTFTNHLTNTPTTPTSQIPTQSPITSSPSAGPTTTKPSRGPTRLPTSQSPTHSPTTSKPSKSPSTSVPTHNPTFTITSSPTFTATVTYLVVAGGGQGGYVAEGGGGGAGGLIASSITLLEGTVITVTVGIGGYSGNSGNGANSIISGSGFDIIAIGGGAGGQSGSSGGQNGGSGGGAPASTTYVLGDGTAGQGNNGGSGYIGGGAGGGGGAGSVGGSATGSNGAGGGTGISSTITGSTVYYAGGGGGGAPSSGGAGGSGGGGNGGGGTDGVSGTIYTGGGGGGGGPSGIAGNGGNGIVILSIPTSLYGGSTTGSPIITTSGSNTILSYIVSGTFTITPITHAPTNAPTPPTTHSPSHSPTTSKPSISPTTSKPSISPTTSKPSISPTKHPSTHSPSHSPTPPTSKPSISPTTSEYNQLGNKLTNGAISLGYVKGLSLNSNGTIMAVGADYNDPIGAVYVYELSGTTWTEKQRLIGTGSTGPNVYQGTAVSISGDGGTILSGGYADNSDMGSIWFFVYGSTSWSQQGSKITPTNPTGTSVAFGTSTSLSNNGNIAVIGSPGDNSNIGAVYVFTRTSGVWSQKQKLIVYDYNSPSFGAGVAISNDGSTIIAGGPNDNDGSASVFVTNSTGQWIEQAYIISPSDAIGGPSFGGAVALNGNGSIAIIGGIGDDYSIGASWIYTQSGSTVSRCHRTHTKKTNTYYSGQNKQN